MHYSEQASKDDNDNNTGVLAGLVYKHEGQGTNDKTNVMRSKREAGKRSKEQEQRKYYYGKRIVVGEEIGV